MTASDIRHLLSLAEESHDAAKILLKSAHPRFSAAQTYYTIFYLAEALLRSKGLTFSSHSAVVAAFGREFARTGLLDPRFHRYLIDAQERREIGHYGEIGEEVTDEQARESYQWAEEFMAAAKKYLEKT